MVVQSRTAQGPLDQCMPSVSLVSGESGCPLSRVHTHHGKVSYERHPCFCVLHVATADGPWDRANIALHRRSLHSLKAVLSNVVLYAKQVLEGSPPVDPLGSAGPGPDASSSEASHACVSVRGGTPAGCSRKRGAEDLYSPRQKVWVYFCFCLRLATLNPCLASSKASFREPEASAGRRTDSETLCNTQMWCL